MIRKNIPTRLTHKTGSGVKSSVAHERWRSTRQYRGASMWPLSHTACRARRTVPVTDLVDEPAVP